MQQTVSGAILHCFRQRCKGLSFHMWRKQIGFGAFWLQGDSHEAATLARQEHYTILQSRMDGIAPCSRWHDKLSTHVVMYLPGKLADTLGMTSPAAESVRPSPVILVPKAVSTPASH